MWNSTHSALACRVLLKLVQWLSALQESLWTLAWYVGCLFPETCWPASHAALHWSDSLCLKCSLKLFGAALPSFFVCCLLQSISTISMLSFSLGKEQSSPATHSFLKFFFFPKRSYLSLLKTYSIKNNNNQ